MIKRYQGSSASGWNNIIFSASCNTKAFHKFHSNQQLLCEHQNMYQNTCVFNRQIIKIWAICYKRGPGRGTLHQAQHTWRCPYVSFAPKTTHETCLRALEGRHASSKSPLRVDPLCIIYMPAPSPYLKVECVKVVEFLECKYSGESEKEIKC